MATRTRQASPRRLLASLIGEVQADIRNREGDYADLVLLDFDDDLDRYRGDLPAQIRRCTLWLRMLREVER